MSDRQESRNSTRREFVQATLVAVGAALVLGILWLVSRAAPSATRDPLMTPPEIVPTPTPTPAPTQVATPVRTPEATLRSRRRSRRPRRLRPLTPVTGGAASPITGANADRQSVREPVPGA